MTAQALIEKVIYGASPAYTLDTFLLEAITADQKRRIERAKPNDKVTVYHGTSKIHLPSLVNGFDATTTRHRDYNGPRHAGLFVTLDPDTAAGFASYGEVVLELEVRAKQLHGTDYSGVIGRAQGHDKDVKSWLAKKYPNSFRPHMVSTMLQSHEPQGLLVGLVSPKQIKRVRWAPYEGGPPRWMTRAEFIKLGIDSNTKRHGGVKPVKDVGIDLSTTRTTVQQLFKAIKAWTNSKSVETVFRTSIANGSIDRVRDLLTNFNFGEKAQTALIRKLKVHFASQ